MAKEYIEVLCPICGRGMGKKATIRKEKVRGRRGQVLMSEDYIDFMLRAYDTKKSFAIVKGTGKAGFKNYKYVGIKYDKEKYDKFKILFLMAIKSYIDKKWLSKKDIENLIK